MAVWRRKTVPACPHCSRAAGPAFHSETAAGFPCNGEVYVDIENGTTLCRRCSDRSSLERFTHVCNQCGCEYVGGEVWQGMRTDLAAVGNRAWVRRIGITKGRSQVRIVKPAKAVNPYLMATTTTTQEASEFKWSDLSGCFGGCLAVLAFFAIGIGGMAIVTYAKFKGTPVPMAIQWVITIVSLVLMFFLGRYINDEFL